VILFGATPKAGLAKLLAPGAPTDPSFAATNDANQTLEANGFGIVRTLAEREGLVFVEGIKPKAQGTRQRAQGRAEG
jgi:hypothetical protein